MSTRNEGTTLVIDEGVLYLMKLILRMPSNGTRLFVTGLSSFTGKWASNFFKHFCTTAITAENNEFTRSITRDEVAVIVNDNRFERYLPPDSFHYAIAAPAYGYDKETKQLVPYTVNDELLFWQCSKNKDLQRAAQLQVIQIEQMYRATLPGGYFGAVLPRNWIGDRLHFMRWFANKAGNVAKIKLPQGAVRLQETGEPVGDWYFYLWTRPTDPRGEGKEKQYAKSLKHAQMRWPTFIQNIQGGMDEESGEIERLGKLFQHTDWWRYHVKLWNEVIKETYSGEYLANQNYAVELGQPDDIRIFKPGQLSSLSFRVVDTVNEIKRDDRAIQVKPGRKVKLSAFNSATAGSLLELEVAAGYEFDNRTETWTSNFQRMLSSGSFSLIKEQLLRQLLEAGLTPYILQRDVQKIDTQERWLQRQLTMIERTVRVKNDAEDGNKVSWEKMYEDVGMNSLQVANVNQWRQRIKKMGIDKLAFDFQAEDLAVLACKDGVLNANVPGLGKTLETLLEFLLRCKKRILIVCPAKLIGEWKTEIEKTLSIFARRQKVNWNKKMINVGFQIIQYAEQCLRHNLKAINIISYEKLWTVPRDAMFFTCDSCGEVVCSPKAHDVQACPTCTKERYADHRKLVAGMGHRKHLVANGNDGKAVKLFARLWRGNKINYEALGKFLAERPEIGLDVNANWRVMDLRMAKPGPKLMTPSKKRYKKMSRLLVGFRKTVKDGISLREPEYMYIERKLHLRWTFSHILRWSFNMVAADEALYIKREDANRARALWKICGDIRRTLTGTPIRGLPKNTLNILNWTVKGNVYPEYRHYDSGSLARFLDKYATYVIIHDKEAGTKKKKLLPKISNPELFQSEIAPMMIRHIKTEPLVAKDVPVKQKIIEPLVLKMDDEHRKYYALWQEKFAEWWDEKRKNVDGKKGIGKEAASGAIIVKLGYLINASTIPHQMYDGIIARAAEKARKAKALAQRQGLPVSTLDDDDFMDWAKAIGPYRGPVTAKQLKALELVKRAKMIGDKILVFSIRRKNLEFGNTWCGLNGINSMIVDGSVSTTLRKDGTSDRSDAVLSFRTQDYHAMWCGLTALAEGVNLPEANREVILDYSWSPDEYKQAIGRVDRPQQTKKIHVSALRHEGTIDDYMYLINELKRLSADEGIDYMEFDLKAEQIPDVKQYADAIVDGTQDKQRAHMQLAVDLLRKKEEEGELDEQS